MKTAEGLRHSTRATIHISGPIKVSATGCRADPISYTAMTRLLHTHQYGLLFLLWFFWSGGGARLYLNAFLDRVLAVEFDVASVDIATV